MKYLDTDARTRITKVFLKVFLDYTRQGYVGDFELHQMHDIHAFYILQDDTSVNVQTGRVIHVQGYPGFSVDSKDSIYVWARMMDYKKMMEIRDAGGVSIGNEHGATIQSFPNFKTCVKIPCDTKVLERMLEENVPGLNFGRRK